MRSEEDQVFPALRKRLTELEAHVEEHDVASADLADIPEFEAMFFSLSRELLLHAFELPKGFTYEEAGSLIEASQRSAPLRAKGTRIANLLNTLEYAPDRSYHEIDAHLIELGELLDLAIDEPKIKHVEKAEQSKLGKAFSMFAKATSIFWFPFKWAYLSLSRKRREKHVDRDGTYEIDRLLERGAMQIEKNQLEDSIVTYKLIVTAYEELPQGLKAKVHERVITFHRSIIAEYEAFKAKKADERASHS